jgi:tetratricopeptide (TPR) repeat protein
MRIRNYFLLLLLFCFCQTGLFAQNPNRAIDSLIAVLKTEKEDTAKVKTLNNLSRQYIKTDKYEEGLKYANEALNLANQILISEDIGKTVIQQTTKREIANTYYNIGNLNSNKSNYPEAIKNINTSLKIRKEIGDKRGIAAAYNVNGTSNF